MPVHLDETSGQQNVKFTLSSTTNLATAVSLPNAADIFTFLFVTNAGQFSWTGTDDVAIPGLHGIPIATDTLTEEENPDHVESDRQRSCVAFGLDDNPSSGELITLNDGNGNVVIFGFGSGGDVTVTIGGSAAATATNWAGDINSSALEVNSAVNPETDTQVDVIGDAAVNQITAVNSSADITVTDLGRDRTIIYLAATTVSTVTHVLTRGA
ncbi:hypothetical protein LCGC14_1723620 [marine sediment metagenome]|uniref:Uncharacterized protein n=1 Tax=marine sediment metagenome TaxID=412755 RepID=A0A0F9HBE8_9ZZZZ